MVADRKSSLKTTGRNNIPTSDAQVSYSSRKCGIRGRSSLKSVRTRFRFICCPSSHLFLQLLQKSSGLRTELRSVVTYSSAVSKSIESFPSVYMYSPGISAPPASRGVRLPLLPISNLQPRSRLPEFYVVSGAISLKGVQTAPTPCLSPVEFVRHFTLSFPTKHDRRARKGSFYFLTTDAFGSDEDCEATEKLSSSRRPTGEQALSISGKYSRLHILPSCPPTNQRK